LIRIYMMLKGDVRQKDEFFGRYIISPEILNYIMEGIIHAKH